MRKSMILVRNKETGNSIKIVVNSNSVDMLIKPLKATEFVTENDVDFAVFENGRMALSDLPEEIQADVMRTLRVYSQAHVYYEYGKFRVSAGSCIKSYYNYDHFYCGTYYAKDVYTEEERREHLHALNSVEFF